MSNRWAPKTASENVRDTARRINLLEREPAPDPSRERVVTALGPLNKVYYTDAAGNALPVTLTAATQGVRVGDTIITQRAGSNVYAIGYVPARRMLSFVPVPLTANWSTYNALNPQTELWGDNGTAGTGQDVVYVTKDANGFVSLTGLVKARAAATQGDAILTLPVGFRPYPGTHIFPGLDGSGLIRIDVQDSGAVNFITGNSTTYIALDNIRFRANGEGAPVAGAAWTNGWADFGAPYASLGMTTDPNGITMLRGLGKPGTTTAGTQFLTYPSGYTVAQARLFATQIGTTSVGRMDLGGVGVTIQVANAGFLSPNLIWTPDSSTALTWYTPVFAGAWVAYGTGFQTPGFTRTADGMVLIRGLIKSGTLASTAFYLPPGFRPRYSTIIAAQSNGVVSRLQVYPDGRVTPQTGDPAFVSIEASFPAWN